MTDSRTGNVTRARLCAAALLASVALVSACQHQARGTSYSGLLATATPVAWRSPGLWEFQVRNDQDEYVGAVLLYLTNISVNDLFCTDRSWQRAVVVYDDLQLDFDLEKQVAYSIAGPWLTVNLTAESCNIGHNFVGEVDDNGASGFFNVTHTFGGETIGKFEARPGNTPDQAEVP